MESLPPPIRVQDHPLFAGDGELAHLMRHTDWATTPLGPVEQWSLSLRMMVQFLLANRFPLLLWWGPDFHQIYNDAYRPVLGTKHPSSLGQAASECWSEIWDIIGPLIETPFTGGPPTWMDDLFLEVNRYGYSEETHFTVAYSPVPDESAPRGIGGVLATVHEISEQVVGARRLAVLGELGARSADAKTAEEACQMAAETLARHPKDLPFVLLYLLDADGQQARLAATAGFETNGRLCAPMVTLQDDIADTGFPIAAVARTQTMCIVERLADYWDEIPPGPWSDPPHSAAVIPIRSSIAHQLSGVLVLGISARLRLDDAYRGFLDLVTSQIATAIANARAYEAERQRAEALAAIDRAKTAFFSNVSHEFRTPLTLLLSPLADVLDDTTMPIPAEHRVQLEVAQRNGQRLLKLVNTLLDFTRIEAGRVEASYVPTDLCAFTADLASVFRSLIEKAGLDFMVQCTPLSESVYVDRDMWEKIVLNLLSNAFKFTFDGHILVQLREQESVAELIVEDTGTGIPTTALPHLFERFYRVEGTRARTHEGSGIGLALVQELVHLHGGTIVITSTEGVGTTVRVRLPLGTQHLPTNRINAPTSLASTAVGADVFFAEAQRWLPVGSPVPTISTTDRMQPAISVAPHPGARIVVADDNADMRDYLMRILGTTYEIEAVTNGSQALMAIQRAEPALVLTDIMMPELDGFGLLQHLRADPRTQALPVILLSARAGEEATIEGLQAGANDYLIKPFSARELLARVAAHLEIARLRQEASARAGELEAVFEAMTDGIDIVDARGIIRQMNQAGHRLAGLHDPETAQTYFAQTPEERAQWLQMRAAQDRLLLPEEAPAARVVRGEILAGPMAVDVQVRTVDGREREWEFSGAPTRDSAGTITGGVVMFHDVTERRALERRTAENLAALLEMAQTLMPGVTGALQMVEAEVNVLPHIARMAKRILGGQFVAAAVVTVATGALEPLVVTGRSPEVEARWWHDTMWGHLTDFLPPTLVERLYAGEVLTVDMVQHPPIPGRYYYDIQHLLSAAVWITPEQVCVMGAEIPPGSTGTHTNHQLAKATAQLFAVGIQRAQLLREQTAAAAREASARAEQQRLLDLIDLAHDAIIVRNSASAILRWNQGAERLYGWSEQEVLGHITHSLFGTRFPISQEAVDAQLAATGQWEGMLTHTRRNGILVQVESRQVLMRDAQGAPTAVLEINRDVTEREHLLQQQAEAEAQLLALAETNRRMDEFLGIASHELRTPLTSISMSVQTAERQLRQVLANTLPDETGDRLRRTHHLAERLIQQVQRMDRLVGDLLDVTRISAGKLEMRMEACDLGDLVRDVVEAQRVAWPQRQVTLALPSTAFPLIIDGDRIGQVVANYLTNALKYSPDDQPVAVHVIRQGKQMRVEVRDHGPGLSPDQQAHVFEQFYRVPGIAQQSGSGTGLGLGLYICQTIITRHGGQVGVQSHLGQGSTFWFTLPRSTSHPSIA
jgi:PAS domain S-box-containing protein